MFKKKRDFFFLNSFFNCRLSGHICCFSSAIEAFIKVKKNTEEKTTTTVIIEMEQYGNGK